MNPFPASIPQRLTPARADARQKVPDTFDVPVTKIYHSHTMRDSRGVAGEAFVLYDGLEVAGFEFPQDLHQQPSAKFRLFGVQVIDTKSARQIERLLRQDITGISAQVHLMHCHPSLFVVFVIYPQKRVGTTMTGQ
jgi:hypothetical protein